jgi:hypothetical protein
MLMMVVPTSTLRFRPSLSPMKKAARAPRKHPIGYLPNTVSQMLRVLPRLAPGFVQCRHGRDQTRVTIEVQRVQKVLRYDHAAENTLVVPELPVLVAVDEA